jgi:hypothetical protein
MRSERNAVNARRLGAEGAISMEVTETYGSALPEPATPLPLEPIVPVFDWKAVALRTVAELRTAAVDDIRLAVARRRGDAEFRPTPSKARA